VNGLVGGGNYVAVEIAEIGVEIDFDFGGGGTGSLGTEKDLARAGLGETGNAVGGHETDVGGHEGLDGGELGGVGN
jgi:hypothetical protein